MRAASLVLACTAVAGATFALLGSCSPSSNDRGLDASLGVEASPDAASEALASGLDAGSEDEGAACRPGSVAGFQPPPVSPDFIARTSACAGFGGEGGLVQAYGDACLGHSATFDTCAAFEVPDAAGASDCYHCLVTPESPDASYGAAAFAVVPVVTYSACVKTLDPTDAGASCGQMLAATYACFEQACKAACPITDEASQTAFVDCSNQAATGACLGYALAAQTCSTDEQGDGGTPVATVCFGGQSAEDHFLSVAHYLCGG
jgi:hypothetical protein